MLAEIAILVVLILANGFFAGAEMAVVAVRRARLATLVEERRRGARAVAALRRAPEQFLATVQIGVTVVGATAAAFGGATLAARLTPLLAGIPGLGAYAHDLALGAVVALVSFLSLVLGELVPKSLALRSPEPVALAVARPLQALSALARPLVWLLTRSSNLVLAPFGDRTTFTEARVSVEEISQMVEEATRSGTLDAKSGEIASRALEFGELTAGDVMVPRNRMAAIRRDASEEELRRVLLEEGHGRLPVYQRTLDDVVGYLVAREALALVWEKGLVVMEDLLRPAHFVPESARAVDVLREMQARRLQLSIVVDEHGGVAGLVTLEDLVEELVGDILAETEVVSPWATREPDGRALLRGDAPLREVNRELDLALPEGDGYSTVAGLCIALAGGIPAAGARFALPDGAALEVVEATARQVRRVRVTPPPRQRARED
ncbi:hemolysin family protein [Anaeromyxobacter diazotrophicus]|uniref:hemolysin family protein n=1 Tax=Anaeromyxobacter diazotrophicus TaxID=2590199 RepID=UPI002101E2C6|nr:hemolysin family protein [Anaeromyxobacter diazotrophicus]